MIIRIHIRIMTAEDEKRFDKDRAENEEKLQQLNSLKKDGAEIIGQYTVTNIDGIPKEHVFVVYKKDTPTGASVAQVKIKGREKPQRNYPKN